MVTPRKLGQFSIVHPAAVILHECVNEVDRLIGVSPLEWSDHMVVQIGKEP
jgi:hypothetical protein